MSKSIGILDKDYAQWVEDLSGRYSSKLCKFSISCGQLE